MDSALSYVPIEEKTENKNRIHTLNTNPMFHSAMDIYLGSISGYFGLFEQPVTLKLSGDHYRYVSIAPITNTDWSVVTFYDSASLYSITNLLPLLIAMLSALLVYALVDSFFIQRLVFSPLNHLTKSLTASNFYISEIFGCDRDDEIGVLAQTIQKMRDRLSTYNAELLRAARERERLIRIDQLTDIPNRRSFDERLPLEWGRAIRTKMPISIIILDLDYFKNYNDTYGHLQCDKALQASAKLFIQELKRSGDLVARWGGEEFAILLSNTDINGGLDVAERIRQRVENLQIPLADGSSSRITVSAGVNSLTPTASSSLEDFIHHADMALYTAKREGRNRVCLYKGIQV
jgi:diguanylate cyclase (GGDEF)-like protein